MSHKLSFLYLPTYFGVSPSLSQAFWNIKLNEQFSDIDREIIAKSIVISSDHFVKKVLHAVNAIFSRINSTFVTYTEAEIISRRTRTSKQEIRGKMITLSQISTSNVRSAVYFSLSSYTHFLPLGKVYQSTESCANFSILVIL